MKGLTSIMNTLGDYLPQICLIVLVIISFTTIIAFKKRRNKSRDRKIIYWMIILSVAFIFNNISMEFMAKLTDSDTFYRFLWAIPVFYLIGYSMVLLLEKRSHVLSKCTLTIMMLLLVAAYVSSHMHDRNISFVGNFEKMPEEVREVCNIIEENKDEENPVCAMELDLQSRVRANNPSLVWAVNRKQYLYFEKYGYDYPNGKYVDSRNILKVVERGIRIDKEVFKASMKKKKLDFLTVNKKLPVKKYLDEVGLELVGETEHYRVYHVPEE